MRLLFGCFVLYIYVYSIYTSRKDLFTTMMMIKFNVFKHWNNLTAAVVLSLSTLFLLFIITEQKIKEQTRMTRMCIRISYLVHCFLLCAHEQHCLYSHTHTHIEQPCAHNICIFIHIWNWRVMHNILLTSRSHIVIV